MSRRAFSIIELVVVIGIVMILIGLLLPTLGSARGSAALLQRVSNVRQIGMIGELYCSDWDDMYAVADDRVDYVPKHLNEDIESMTLGRAWPNALLDAGVADTSTTLEVLQATPLTWSATMYLSPTVLQPDTLVPWEDLRTTGVYRSRSSMPSRKGLLSVRRTFRGPDEVVWALARDVAAPVFAADGSVQHLEYRELTTPNPAPMLGYGVPLITTWSGIQGYDW